jgi:quercetin dioxygenase-like cupin family protein
MAAQIDNVVRIGALELRFLVDETHGSGSVVMFEFAIPPNARVPVAHYHRDVDEVVYGLEGTTTSTLDGTRHELRRGDTLFIPRGRVHTHENLHGETARTLIVLTPGSIGRRYFEEIAAEVNGPGKPDPARIGEIMQRHGLVPA